MLHQKYVDYQSKNNYIILSSLSMIKYNEVVFPLPGINQNSTVNDVKEALGKQLKLTSEQVDNLNLQFLNKSLHHKFKKLAEYGYMESSFIEMTVGTARGFQFSDLQKKMQLKTSYTSDHTSPFIIKPSFIFRGICTGANCIGSGKLICINLGNLQHRKNSNLLIQQVVILDQKKNQFNCTEGQLNGKKIFRSQRLVQDQISRVKFDEQNIDGQRQSISQNILAQKIEKLQRNLQDFPQIQPKLQNVKRLFSSCKNGNKMSQRILDTALNNQESRFGAKDEKQIKKSVKFSQIPLQFDESQKLPIISLQIPVQKGRNTQLINKKL